MTNWPVNVHSLSKLEQDWNSRSHKNDPRTYYKLLTLTTEQEDYEWLNNQTNSQSRWSSSLTRYDRSVLVLFSTGRMVVWIHLAARNVGKWTRRIFNFCRRQKNKETVRNGRVSVKTEQNGHVGRASSPLFSTSADDGYFCRRLTGLIRIIIVMCY
jgi:hypothetical protein